METSDDKSTLTYPPFPFDKPLHRKGLRELPLPEKVRIVVELQKIAAPILRARGEKPFVWKLEHRAHDETESANHNKETPCLT